VPLLPPEGRVPRARFLPTAGFQPRLAIPRLAVPVAVPVPSHVHVVPVPLVIRPGPRSGAEEQAAHGDSNQRPTAFHLKSFLSG
jgi:hypothetical protein